MNYTELKKLTVKAPSSHKLKSKLRNKIKNALSNETKLATPMIRASYAWSIISEQLKDVLGSEIHSQWFSKVKPVVITDNVLLLETKDKFSSQWINANYQELVDLLVGLQDKTLSSFFFAPSLKKMKTSLKSSTSKINGQGKHQNS